MYLIHAVLVATEWTSSYDPQPGTVGELLWLRAHHTARLEHVSVVATPGRVHLGLFHLGETESASVNAARQLCLLALAGSPVLAGWQLADLAPVSTLDLL